jgi:hypothetical protein
MCCTSPRSGVFPDIGVGSDYFGVKFSNLYSKYEGLVCERL